MKRKGKVKMEHGSVGTGKKTVLVGTYRRGQLEQWPGYYNYPLTANDEFDIECAKKVNEIWLFQGTKGGRFYTAEFVGNFTRDELKAQFAYPAKGKGHGGRYLLYRIGDGEIYDPASGMVDAVIVRSADFATVPKVRHQIKVYLESQNRQDAEAAKFVPDILTRLPRDVLRVSETAVQMEFSQLFCPEEEVKSQRSDHIHIAQGKFQRTAMSLFSGAGGLDIGVVQAGFDVLSCVELDHNACNTLRRAVSTEHRHTKVYEGDIKSFSPEQMLSDLGKKVGEIDLLFGGPPCQAFSLIGKQKALEDERGMLLFQMIRYARAIRPKVVLMEQVKGLLSAKDAKGRRGGVFEKLLQDFESLGYVVKYKVCVAADYGVAQLRERVILVATRDENGFQFPLPKFQDPSKQNLFVQLPAWRTVGDVLAGLGSPHLKEKGVTVYPDEYWNHVDVTPCRDRERIRYVPEGLYLASQTQLPPDILGNLKPRDTTKYLRLNRGKPSNTLRCGEIFFHPTEDRYLTPREYMRIHGYPDSYVLEGPIRSRTGSVRNLDQHRQVANSVPPPLAHAIAEQIMEYLGTREREDKQ